MKDEWTSGYDYTRMDERRNNIYGPLMYKKDISYFHVGIYRRKIIMNQMGCLKKMIIQYKNGRLPFKKRGWSGHQISY
jgi:hypothetical protein